MCYVGNVYLNNYLEKVKCLRNNFLEIKKLHLVVNIELWKQKHGISDIFDEI